jgi:hypothetical protein
MAKDPRKRYASAKALRNDLERILCGDEAKLEDAPVAATESPIGFSGFSVAKTQFYSGWAQRCYLGIAVLALSSVLAFCYSSSKTKESNQTEQSDYVIRDELREFVKVTTEGKPADGPTARRILRLVESYKNSECGKWDRTELALAAKFRVAEYYRHTNDMASVRRLCKQILEEYSGVDEDNCTYFLRTLELYHESCEAAGCQLSLVPLLQQTLQRYPDGPKLTRSILSLLLAEDYALMKRFDAAREIAQNAGSLAGRTAPVWAARRQRILDECQKNGH